MWDRRLHLIQLLHKVTSNTENYIWTFIDPNKFGDIKWIVAGVTLLEYK